MISKAVSKLESIGKNYVKVYLESNLLLWYNRQVRGENDKSALAEWFSKQTRGHQVLKKIRIEALREKTSEESFADFLDIWEFYWQSGRAASDERLIDDILSDHKKIAAIFKALKNNV